MIHKIHQGHTLVKQNYHYAGLAFNNKGFSKLGEGQKMCTTCHGGADATTANNYNQIPSRKSCGACHDGIKWDTGTGSTLGDKMKVVYAADTLPSTGHVGGAYQDDGTCKSCHTAENIKISHRTENITKNNPQITDGLAIVPLRDQVGHGERRQRHHRSSSASGRRSRRLPTNRW